MPSTLPFNVTKPASKHHHKYGDMNKNASAPVPRIYPARYFPASPTWMQWNKLTAADVHALKQEPGFEGQSVFFHLNHPIQFIRVVGVIVDIDSIAGGKYTLLTLDDGSGRTIVAKITARALSKDDPAQYPSNTVVDNINIDNINLNIDLGRLTVSLDSKPIEIGSIVKAKGTISSFRGVRQIELKRMSMIKDTNAEVQAWTETAAWKRDVLSKPWVLTTAQRYGVDDRVRKAEKEARERTRKKKEWSAKYEEKKRRHEMKYEAKRAEEEKRLNLGALKGSHVIAEPWG